MKIPIHKHTPVRRPMSKHVIALRNNAEVLRGKALKTFLYVETVTDISRVEKFRVRDTYDCYANSKLHENLYIEVKPLTFLQNIKYHIIWWKK